MATLQKEQRGSKVYWRVQWMGTDKRRQRIRLGEMPENTARYIFSRVDQLIAAQAVGQPIDSDTLKWLDKLSDDLHAKLSDKGLCDERKRSTLQQFIDGYIASRKDAATNTVRNWRNSKKKLVGHFGGDCLLHAITPGDADDWRQGLVNAGHSPSTISKAVKHAKQFLGAAVRKGYIESNPFADLVAGGERNDDRKFFVPREAIAKALDEAPDVQWRAIIALSRFGGLRCPSEVLELTWDDINWDQGRIRVTSRKTKRHGKGFRLVPLFPELRPFLDDAFHQADDGATHVITRYRDANANLRTQFCRILARAGIKPWERLFHNMRASRQTELANIYPAHVVCDWMGNSEAVAKDHYLQTTDEHFEQAIRGAQCGASEPVWGIVGHKVGRKPPAADREKTQETPVKTTKGQVLPAPVFCAEHPLGEWNTQPNARSLADTQTHVGHNVGQCPHLDRLLRLWPTLSDAAKARVVELAQREAEAPGGRS